MVREGGLCTRPGSSTIPPHGAGDSRGRWRCHTRVQESELGGGVAGRVVGRLAQVWSVLLRDAFSKRFGSGAPSTAIGQPHVWKWTKCHRRGGGGCDNPSFENGALSIAGFGTAEWCAETWEPGRGPLALPRPRTAPAPPRSGSAVAHRGSKQVVVPGGPCVGPRGLGLEKRAAMGRF